MYLVGHDFPKGQQIHCSEQVKFLKFEVTTHKLSEPQSLSSSNTALTVNQTGMAVT